MMEMMGMTGLSVGEVNKTLQAQIDTLKAEAAEKKRIDSRMRSRDQKLQMQLERIS
jgi:hypothetical protein